LNRTPNRASPSPTTRFTDRVENYVKARPSYPAALIPLLVENCGLDRESTVLDVGCGTGLLAELFCEFGSRVIGVEPNAAMRAAGQQHLARYSSFRMIEGTAESVTVPDASVDFVTAGQAFHWFDIDAARLEFLRVLKPEGWAVLVWNVRIETGSRFAESYEALLATYGIDYAEVYHGGKATDETFLRFFGNRNYVRRSFPNAQQLDYDQLVARLLSSSYMPTRGHAAYAPMMEEVRRIFAENALDGRVTMRYTTTVTYGHLS
jgi:ubiquinone/menaquinone biosynthesis C-methylase UbiE